MKKLLFSCFLSLFFEYRGSNAILDKTQSFPEYQTALRDFYDILEACRENHLVRKSFITYAKYNLFYEEYLDETAPCYLEQLIYEFRCLLNSFAAFPSEENEQKFTKAATDLKTKCYARMDYILKRFR